MPARTCSNADVSDGRLGALPGLRNGDGHATAVECRREVRPLEMPCRGTSPAGRIPSGPARKTTRTVIKRMDR